MLDAKTLLGRSAGEMSIELQTILLEGIWYACERNRRVYATVVETTDLAEIISHGYIPSETFDFETTIAGTQLEYSWQVRQIIDSLTVWAQKSNRLANRDDLIALLRAQGAVDVLDILSSDRFSPNEPVGESVERPVLVAAGLPGTADIPPLPLSSFSSPIRETIARRLSQLQSGTPRPWPEMWGEEKEWVSHLIEGYKLSSAQSSSLRAIHLEATQRIVARWDWRFVPWSERRS